HAPNPPYGAILYYRLSQPPAGEMKLQAFDAAGALVRTISSIPPPPIEGVQYPDYWLASPASRALPTMRTCRRHPFNHVHLILKIAAERGRIVVALGVSGGPSGSTYTQQDA
ncbi:MAG TPA: hypothetical protein VEL51_02765, partial [Vicinamibacterales bacterium]|nr:hypothetical protein [Vicinamibacterales bacterium]